MSSRLGQPFPNATPAMREAYANAAYVQVAYNAGVDPATGEIVIDIHGSEVRGTIGEVMERDEFFVNQAPKGDEIARLNLAFMMGHLSAKLEGMKQTTPTTSERLQNG